MLNSFNSKRKQEAEEALPREPIQAAPVETSSEDAVPAAISPEDTVPVETSPDDTRQEHVEGTDLPVPEADVAAAPDEEATPAQDGDASNEREVCDCETATQDTVGSPRTRGGKVPVGGLKGLWQGSSVWRAAVLGTLIYLAFVNVGYFLFMKPIGERLAGLQDRASVLNDFAVIQESSAAIAQFTEGLMNGDQRMTVMSEVNVMAKDSGVRVMGDPELLLPREVTESITEYPIRLRVKGTYDEIGGFLSLLESSPRFVQVEQVEIQSEVDSRDRESEATMLLAIASWEG